LRRDLIRRTRVFGHEVYDFPGRVAWISHCAAVRFEARGTAAPMQFAGANAKASLMGTPHRRAEYDAGRRLNTQDTQGRPPLPRSSH